MARLAIDIGGTFTDLAWYDLETGELRVEKTLTTVSDLSVGVLDAIRLAAVPHRRIDAFVHGGTTVINALTERKGARTALVTTRGFRDVLEIGRGNRPDLYNLVARKPEPFVPRRLSFELGGRLDARGRELEPLDLAALDEVAGRCRALGVEAVAIQLLHSWADPAHERAAAERLRELLPGVAITASHSLTREWREYERACTAVLNAFVQPVVEAYLGRLEAELERVGIRCPRLAMQSNGGTTTFAHARSHPITLVESGPAGGVQAAVYLADHAQLGDLIYFDVGGTTAKCSLVRGGRVPVHTDYAIERTRRNPGYPIKVPVIDIVEIGAGGGSIASVGGDGRLRVGPESAGAEPGPAAYARGGTEPTVTDAMLLTGILDPDGFAGGRIRLDRERAERAMAPLAAAMGTDPATAALAVIRLAEASMANALSLVSIQRGHDPRDFALLVGGGGGGLHGARLARELGARALVVPPHPGYFSAVGMLATEPRRDLVRTVLMTAAEATPGVLAGLFAELEAEARDYMAAMALDPNRLRVQRRIDLRYRGQEHWVEVPTESYDIAAIVADFHALHERAFTFRLDDTSVELVNARLTATVPVPRPTPARHRQGGSVEAARKVPRRILLPEVGWAPAQVYDRERLPAGARLEGPALLEEASTTILVLPGQRLEVDGYGLLIVTEIGD